MVSENLCNGCDLCCRKYKIYLFPNEAKAISRKLNMNYKEFVQKYLNIYVEFFPYQQNMKNDFLESSYNNKKYFVFLTLALKQEKETCVFLQNKQCIIYGARPLICRLFPDFKFYGETFDFCKLDKQNRKAEDPRVFYPLLTKYLKDIKHNGFENVWKYLPEIQAKNIYFCVEGKKKTVSEDLLLLLKDFL
jgi:Fe-S-cluster containining protein